MLRVTKLLRGREVDATRVVDVVVLNFERRRHCHGTLLGTKGTRLLVAFADEELVECVGIDANAAELMRVVFLKEGFELGFVGWTAPFVLRLKREIEIGQALDVGSIDAGDRRVGVVPAAAADEHSSEQETI